MSLKPGADLMNTVDGAQWKEMIVSGARALEEKKAQVDALNVFPVPDGDTGTNMHLTIQSAAREVAKLSNPSLAEAAAVVSMGSLMGARGNSGVILSQLMRGVAKGLDGLDAANATQVAQSLQTGVETAYKAVMKPVEGTILTVAKETARGALARAKQGGGVLAALREGCQKGEKALARTPELLPVLKRAGVVDAGGQGFILILRGWISALEGNSVVPEGKTVSAAAPDLTERSAEPAAGGLFRVEDLEYPYCTEFLLKGREIPLERIKQDMADWGDSMLVVGTPEVAKIHIHTKNPGQVLDYALRWGALHEVAIHNMLAQNEAAAHAAKEMGGIPGEETAGVAGAGEGQSVEGQKNDETSPAQPGEGGGDSDVSVRGTEAGSRREEPLKEQGVVAVAAGEGIARVFASLGADGVVSGGQTMNPSTEDLAAAVRKVRARHIFILPNNPNIVMAAEQVRELVTDRRVEVIASSSIPQGIAALVNFQTGAKAEENAQAMREALERVGSGEITYAVRDSQFEGFEIGEGDILGLAEGELVAVGKDVLTVTEKTLEKMDWRNYDLVTVFYGQETEAEEAKKLENWLQTQKSEVEVEVYPGGQPLYYYILGVE
ncbi:glycerone kinase [Acididesulfobacillus acetoxydans]|uniref:DAK2 domain fusion protein YloV n=1 Tax=Acididesulfobacillus acetoxydans TaxID=1561005 RepID=A0A8S0Y449_9FIRM|nr:DAK2 domain-containing protein [Acididesulfobacillus acetoxydans]CAA7602745.1 glycerone kinase [Acididesulfobacillus acetoxydans]CEJ06398.1 DAK2 domain fusion protein YloV [Acididesulfobacillus acetoxydans]